MSKYTAEQVQLVVDRGSWGSSDCVKAGDMLRAYAALLRERESAKAEVTYDMINAAMLAYNVACHSQGDMSNAGYTGMRAALEAVAPMLASARVPDDDTIDAVTKALRRAWNLGQTYWQQADSESYSQNKKSNETQAKFMQLIDDTAAMLAAAPKPEVSERHHWLCCGALKPDHSDKPRVMPDCFDPERHVWAVSPKPETEE